MASSNGVVRFVKCPKCYKVLAEFADVPVYKCGGCGAILRAKVRASTTEKTVGESLENNFQKPADSSSLVNESISSANHTHASALEVEKVVHSDLHVSNSNIVLDTTRKEVSEPEENRAEGRPLESLESDVQSSLRRSDTNAKERTQASQEVFVDEEVGKSMSSALQDPHGSSVNEIVEEPSYNSGNGAVFIEEDTKLTSLAYDGSVSSRDEQEDRVPHKHLAKSSRTFRRQKFLSVDDTTRKSMDDSIGKETQPQAQTRRSCARDTTFGSEDFHSVQNWMGSEIDDDLISIPSDLLLQGKSFKSSNANPSTKVKYLDSDHLKILRKVDELRDELSDFLTKTEGKQASRLKPRTTRFAPKYSCSDRKGPMHKDEGEKHAKVKKPAIKQYYRPVYGGAPFVICYKCWKLLQLPADFLVTRKRLHKLRCGACSEVLVFSFRPRTHSAPHSPVEAQHPPSEVDQTNDIIRGGDFVSRSESFSSEPEPVHNVSRSSSYSIKAGAKGSSLHGLMGYSSASELLFEPIRVIRGYESSQTTTPEFYRPPPREDRRRYGQYGTGTSAAKSIEIEEEEESHEQITTRRRGSAIPGLSARVESWIGEHEAENSVKMMNNRVKLV